MQTPDEYLQHLDEGVITEQMLSDCLFSVNKRAKNYRDKGREKRREIRNLRSGYISEGDRWEIRHLREGARDAREARESYYQMKELLLSVIEPAYMHREVRLWEETRYWEYESGFKLCESGDFEERLCLHDRLKKELKCRIVRKPAKVQYFFVYEVGGRSFHKPLTVKQAKKQLMKGYEVKELVDFVTHGMDVQELLPMQFVEKVAELVESGKYRYLPNSSC